jgi:hypothetical protein
LIERALMRTRWATAVLLAGPASFPSSAWADPSASVTPDATPKNAAALVAEGVKAFHEQQYDGARQAFLQAYDLAPLADTLLDLALAELEAHRPVEAVNHLKDYLVRTDAPAAKREVVRTQWLPLAEAKTARLDVFAARGAEIRVDGVLAESMPLPSQDSSRIGEPPASSLRVAAGDHEVSVGSGALMQSQHVVAKGGEWVEVHFQRAPDAPSPVANSNAATIVTPTLEGTDGSAKSRGKWITLLGFESAAAIAAGVAMGFSLSVEQSASDANRLMGIVRVETGGNSGCLVPADARCAEISRDRQAEQSNGALANGLYAGAGALAVIGAASVLLWPSSPERSASALHPRVLLGDRTAGAALAGTW